MYYLISHIPWGSISWYLAHRAYIGLFFGILAILTIIKLERKQNDV